MKASYPPNDALPHLSPCGATCRHTHPDSAPSRRHGPLAVTDQTAPAGPESTQPAEEAWPSSRGRDIPGRIFHLTYVSTLSFDSHLAMSQASQACMRKPVEGSSACRSLAHFATCICIDDLIKEVYNCVAVQLHQQQEWHLHTEADFPQHPS